MKSENIIHKTKHSIKSNKIIYVKGLPTWNCSSVTRNSRILPHYYSDKTEIIIIVVGF